MRCNSARINQRTCPLRHYLTSMTAASPQPAVIVSQDTQRRGGGGAPHSHQRARLGIIARGVDVLVACACLQLRNVLRRMFVTGGSAPSYYCKRSSARVAMMHMPCNHGGLRSITTACACQISQGLGNGLHEIRLLCYQHKRSTVSALHRRSLLYIIYPASSRVDGLRCSDLVFYPVHGDALWPLDGQAQGS